MFDGFTQLNNVMDNFKEILGEVGSIFSAVFGPALHTLNSILEIPFVKSTTAWVIAIGSVTVAYLSLISLIKKIQNSLLDTNKILKSNNRLEHEQNKLNQMQTLLNTNIQRVALKYTNNLQKQLKLRAKLVYLTKMEAQALQELPIAFGFEDTVDLFTNKKSLKNRFNYADSPEYKKFLEQLKIQIPTELSFILKDESKYWDILTKLNRLNLEVHDDLAKDIMSLADSEKQAILESEALDDSLKELTRGLMEGKDGMLLYSGILIKEMTGLVQGLNFAGGSIAKIKMPDGNKLKNMTSIWRSAAGIGATITAVLSGLTIKSGFTATLTAIKNGFAYIMSAIKGFAAGMGGIAGALKGLAVASGWVVIIVGGLIALVDGIKMLYNVFTGQTWNQGTITGWVADWLSGVSDAQEKMNQINALIKEHGKHLKEIEGLEKELKQIHWDEWYKKLLPAQQVANLKNQISTVVQEETKLQSNLKTLKGKVEEAFKEYRRVISNGLTDKQPEAEKNYNAAKEELINSEKRLTEITKQRYSLQNDLATKQKELITIQKEFINSIDALRNKMYRYLGNLQLVI